MRIKINTITNAYKFSWFFFPFFLKQQTNTPPPSKTNTVALFSGPIFQIMENNVSNSKQLLTCGECNM